WQVRLRPLCGSAAWWSPGRRRAPFAAAASLSRRIRPQPGMPVDRDVERGARRARRRAPRPPRTRARVACARGLECPRTSRSREWREIAWPNRGGSRARPQRASLPACPCSACGARAVPPAAEAASTGTALATLSDMNTSPSLFVSVAAAGLAGVAAFLTPNTARADRVVVEESSEDYEARHSLDVAFDGEGAIPLMDRRFQSGNDLTGGGGFKVRVGGQIRFPRLSGSRSGFTPTSRFERQRQRLRRVAGCRARLLGLATAPVRFVANASRVTRRHVRLKNSRIWLMRRFDRSSGGAALPPAALAALISACRVARREPSPSTSSGWAASTA